MWKRRIILAICLVALLFGAQRLWVWREEARQAQYQAYLHNITDADPYKRLLAAEGLLRRDPTDNDRRLIRAKALMALNRHAEAREELEILIGKGTPDLEKYAVLQIESYFQESERLVSGTDRMRASAVVERVEALMTGVLSQSKLITSKGFEFEIKLIEARRYDALAKAHRFALEGKKVDLTKARIAEIHQTMETLGLEVTEIQKLVSDNDAKLLAACDTLMKMQPQHPMPVELLFHTHLRRGEFSQARSAAKMMLTLNQVDSETLARLADAILNLEARFGEPVSTADHELAAQLLAFPNQTGVKSLTFQLAQATLAIAQGNATEAKTIARQIVTEEWLHARARCLLAQSFLLENDPKSAIEILQKYTELKENPLVRYTLGLAYLATDEPSQKLLGQEALRQCLDIEPNHLPARLRLIESLFASDKIFEASDDVLVVEQINPRHPRVLSLKAQLAIETEDLATIAQLIDSQLITDATVLNPTDVVLVVGMILDDVPRVRRLAAEMAQAHPHDVFVLLTERWAELDPVKRARIAPVIVRSLHAYLDRDPMTNPLRPAVPKLGALAMQTQTTPNGVVTNMPASNDPLEPLTQSYFIARPLDVALSMTQIALDRWPLNAALISSAMELNIWRNRIREARQWQLKLPPHAEPAKDSLDAAMQAYLQGQFDVLQTMIDEARLKNHGALTPTHRLFALDLALRSQDAKRISEQLLALLQSHPWAEAALAAVVADAIQHDQPDRAYAILGVAGQVNIQLASLTRGRLNLGMGRPADALHDVEQVVANENANTEVRRWASEVRARAHLMLDQQSLAVGVFDMLAQSQMDQRIELRQAAADVLIAFGKPTAAAEVLSEIVSMADNPSRNMDQLLARAELTMKPSRVRTIVETLLTYRANDPVLLLYQARAIASEDDLVAERVIKSVLAREPNAVRALMEMAQLMRKIQPDETRRIYTELSKLGGRAGAAAQQSLDEMNQGGTKPSSAASVEGITE